MADYKTLILSNDFKQYRKKQLAEAVGYIHGLIKKSYFQTVTPEELSGALEMANRLIRLPLKLIDDNATKDELNKQIQEDLIGLSTSLVRQYFEE